MACSPGEEITKKELERSRLTLIIHHVDSKMTTTDIERLIKSSIGQSSLEIKFSKIYEMNGKDRKNAYLNFKEEKGINALLSKRPIMFQKEELTISRYNPKNVPYAGQVFYHLLVKFDKTTQNLNRKPTEYDINKYFGQYGEIISCKWETNREAILQFKDYDSVDRIILAGVSHTINGIKVYTSKFPFIQSNVYNKSSYRQCIHVSNMPIDVTSEELSNIFQVDVADILIKPGYQLNEYLSSDDQRNSEAWIKPIDNQKSLIDLVNNKSKTNLRGFEIYCDIINEPYKISELCREFEKDACQYLQNQCYYKHILCDQPDSCKDEECHYGYSKNRPIQSTTQNMKYSQENLYRVRISNIPPTTTREQLQKWLNIPEKNAFQIKFSENDDVDSSKVAYFVNQSSENLLRKQIRKWHNEKFTDKRLNKIKYQLELNVNYYNWDDESHLSKMMTRSRTCSSTDRSTSSVQSKTRKDPPWLPIRNESSPISTQSKQFICPNSKQKKISDNKIFSENKIEKPLDINQYAPEWYLTDEILSNDPNGNSVTYSLSPHNGKEIKAAIKIYKNNIDNKQRILFAKREILVFEKLKELYEIPKLILGTENNPWILMENIQGLTLYDFLQSKSIGLEGALRITLNLLNTVKQIHNKNIVHRKMNPYNIILKDSSIQVNDGGQYLFEKMKFILIDFDLSSIDQEIHENNQVIDQTLCTYSATPGRVFYHVPQIAKQIGIHKIEQNQSLYSRTIDASHLCAILFWLITTDFPLESKDINGRAPHEKLKYEKIIKTEIIKATGIWRNQEVQAPLAQHLKLVFDRGFSDIKLQWSMEELEYQIQLMIQFLGQHDNQKNFFPKRLSVGKPKFIFNNSTSNSFIQIASFIDSIKQELVLDYESFLWSTDEKSQWSGNNNKLQHYDSLFFHNQEFDISMDVKWNAIIKDQKQLHINITVRVKETIFIELPLGVWDKTQMDNIRPDLLKHVEFEFTNLINFLYNNQSRLSIE